MQKLTSEGLVQQLMSMDLSMEAQASLKDLLLESQVLNIATEEAQVIAFLLFAAWQRAQVTSASCSTECTFDFHSVMYFTCAFFSQSVKFCNVSSFLVSPFF